jgi:hypothetical protein
MRDGQVRTVCQRGCGWLALIVLAAGLTFANAANHYDKMPERVIAIGDVHGDFDDFCLVLKKVGLADSENHWIGGKAILVQTGDVIDRGNKDREAMDLLIRLEKEAEAAGGAVVSLMGNHEVMNIVGDLRYVSAETYAEFADKESDERREAAYQDYAAWYTTHAESLKAIQQTVLPATKQEWMAKHPAGFLEYRQALDPTGAYGKWVRQHPAVAKIGGVVFLHGGLSPNLVSLKLEQITEQVRAEVKEFDKTKRYLVSHHVILPFFTLEETVAAVKTQIRADRGAETSPDVEEQSMMLRLAGIGNWLCMREDGPLWFRSYDEWSEEEGTQQIEKILASYEAAHVVVGHTVQKTASIRCRFGGRVFLIDTGMLSTYWRGGRGSALEIIASRTFNGVYLGGQERLWEEKLIGSGKEK